MWYQMLFYNMIMCNDAAQVLLYLQCQGCSPFRIQCFGYCVGLQFAITKLKDTEGVAFTW